MITVFPDQPIKAFSPFVTRSLILCIVILFTCSCTSQEEKHQAREKKITHIEINGFKVPHLPSASEQLFFARVSDTHLPRQIALFNAVSLLFPKEKIQSGHAEIEIAYLQLGDDYRRSSARQQINSGDSYLKIAAKYHDIPEIAAKALWYHGWITADLLDQKPVGTTSFEKIVQNYPYQPIFHPPFVSWTSINLKHDRKISTKNSSKAVLTWGEFAYLELIRHGESAKACLAHFKSLLQRAPKNSVIQDALNLLAERDYLQPEMISVIKHEIEKSELGQKEIDELRTLLLKEQAEAKR